MAKPDYDAPAHDRVLTRAVLLFGASAAVLAALNQALGSHELHRSLDTLPFFEVMHGFTALGDGGFALVVALWLALRRSTRAEWTVFLVGFAVSALVPQLAKNLIWPDLARPYGVVEGIRHSVLLEPAMLKTFPSGHSATGTFLALFLAYRKPEWSWLYLALGVGVGLSRLFLHYHWVEDVVAGWLIGLCSAWLAERTLGPKLNTHGTT
ncbi:MAG: phosphatase PAP2 family protein [Bacteroidota bacterium]